MKIIGAGLSGLLAGCLIPGSTIYEQQSELPNNHGAVLRFRSDAISRALNIPFKKVEVHKAVFYEEILWDFATIEMMNKYSKKVTGHYLSRSIGDCSTVTRYIAPFDFIQLLAERCEICFDFPWDKSWHANETTISTIPMQRMMTILGFSVPGENVTFFHQPIWSMIYEFKDIDLYQTIYFPSQQTKVYRASFTGNRLIVEMMSDPSHVGAPLDMVLRAFGIYAAVPYSTERKEQQYGKIIDIDPHIRRSIMATLTHEHNIYSLGRYATWRNILLDDVFEDIYKIMDLVKLDSYSRRLKL